MFVTVAGFASDAITLGNRLTLNAGLRFDHSDAIVQDLPALDAQGHETDQTVHGLGTLYTWNLWSPRFGVTAKLTADGRTLVTRGDDGKLLVWIDDKKMVDVDRAEKIFSLRNEVDLSKPLGIATWSTKGAVRTIKIRELPKK